MGYRKKMHNREWGTQLDEVIYEEAPKRDLQGKHQIQTLPYCCSIIAFGYFRFAKHRARSHARATFRLSIEINHLRLFFYSIMRGEASETFWLKSQINRSFNTAAASPWWWWWMNWPRNRVSLNVSFINRKSFFAFPHRDSAARKSIN